MSKVSAWVLAVLAVCGFVSPGGSEATVPAAVPADVEAKLRAYLDAAAVEGMNGATALAKLANEEQRAWFADEVPPAVPLAVDSLEEAARSLADRLGTDLGAESIVVPLRLPVIPELVSTSLRDVLLAYLSFHDATMTAFALPGSPASGFGAVAASRVALIDAAARLQGIVEGGALEAVPCASPFQIPPVLSVDYSGCYGQTYTANFALMIDLGGSDTYNNNAGGNNLLGDHPDCGEWLPSLVPGSMGILPASAALVDTSGNDKYTSGRCYGINGGALFGSGFLYDGAGSDTYAAGTQESGNGGTNGGGDSYALGFLLDVSGADTYTAGMGAANGGAAWFSGGLLVDAGAEGDTYRAKKVGANGGADYESIGFLLDRGGNDAYYAEELGANGGGYYGSSGHLVDLGGNDAYILNCRSPWWPYDYGYPCWTAANGAGWANGRGLLLDARGRDTYSGDYAAGIDRTYAPKGCGPYPMPPCGYGPLYPMGIGAQVDVPG